MRDIVRVLDKEFEKYISAQQIGERVAELARRMNEEISTLNPVFLAVLNGSFFFAADLLKEIHFPCEISFVKVSSYRGMESSGNVQTLIGLDETLMGRNVVVLEDIVDTGNTMKELLQQLKGMHTTSVRIATLVLKPEALEHQLPLDYVGFEAPNVFIIGYGLDYDKQGRNYKDIYILKRD